MLLFHRTFTHKRISQAPLVVHQVHNGVLPTKVHLQDLHLQPSQVRTSGTADWLTCRVLAHPFSNSTHTTAGTVFLTTFLLSQALDKSLLARTQMSPPGRHHHLTEVSRLHQKYRTTYQRLLTLRLLSLFRLQARVLLLMVDLLRIFNTHHHQVQWPHRHRKVDYLPSMPGLQAQHPRFARSLRVLRLLQAVTRVTATATSITLAPALQASLAVLLLRPQLCTLLKRLLVNVRTDLQQHHQQSVPVNGTMRQVQ